MKTKSLSPNMPNKGQDANKASPQKARFSAPMLDRLMARLNQEGPLHSTEPDKGRCWLSSYRKVGNGYPQIHGPKADGSKGQQYTHRVMWEHLNGPVPPSLVVMHTCDNRACCNPDHLTLGTQADNVHDMMKKGRAKSGKRLSLLEIGRIKALRAAGSTIVQIAKQVGRDLSTVRKAIRQASNPDQPDLFGNAPATA